MLSGYTILTFTNMDVSKVYEKSSGGGLSRRRLKFNTLQVVITNCGGTIVNRTDDLDTESGLLSLKTYITSLNKPCLIKPDTSEFKYLDKLKAVAAR